jgi:hypothetical protein
VPSLLFAVFAVFAVFAGNLQRASVSLPRKPWNLDDGDDRKTAEDNPSFLLIIGMNNVLSLVPHLSYFDYR